MWPAHPPSTHSLFPFVCIGWFVFDQSKLFSKMDAAPSAKRSKLDNGASDAYIPTQEHTDGEPMFAVIFSLHEEKGALARALKPFEVRGKCTSVNRDGCVQFVNSSRWPYLYIGVERRLSIVRDNCFLCFQTIVSIFFLSEASGWNVHVWIASSLSPSLCGKGPGDKANAWQKLGFILKTKDLFFTQEQTQFYAFCPVCIIYRI